MRFRFSFLFVLTLTLILPTSATTLCAQDSQPSAKQLTKDELDKGIAWAHTAVSKEFWEAALETAKTILPTLKTRAEDPGAKEEDKETYRKMLWVEALSTAKLKRPAQTLFTAYLAKYGDQLPPQEKADVLREKAYNIKDTEALGEGPARRTGLEKMIADLERAKEAANQIEDKNNIPAIQLVGDLATHHALIVVSESNTDQLAAAEMQVEKAAEELKGAKEGDRKAAQAKLDAAKAEVDAVLQHAAKAEENFKLFIKKIGEHPRLGKDHPILISMLANRRAVFAVLGDAEAVSNTEKEIERLKAANAK